MKDYLLKAIIVIFFSMFIFEKCQSQIMFIKDCKLPDLENLSDTVPQCLRNE